MSLRGAQRRGNPKLLLENKGLFFFYIKKAACPHFIMTNKTSPYVKKSAGLMNQTPTVKKY